MLRYRRRILWSLALLLISNSLTWAQERTYGPNGDFSLVLPRGWTTRAFGSTLEVANSGHGSPIHLSASTLQAHLPEMVAQHRQKEKWVVGDIKLVKRPRASFQVAELTDYTYDPPSKWVWATLSVGPDLWRGDISAHFPEEISDAQFRELMEIVYSFRLEDGAKRAPKTDEDDF